MRKLLAYGILLLTIVLTASLAQEKKPPVSLVLQAKNGNVTYNHATHAKRQKDDCASCHPSLFAQDAKSPLNFKANMHRTAEEKKTSCGSCHHEGGKAFATKGNCTSKCHVKPEVKKA